METAGEMKLLHVLDNYAHVERSSTLSWGGLRLKGEVSLDQGNLIDLRSVFRNCLLKRSLVEASFTNNILWKCVKDEAALCQKRTLWDVRYLQKQMVRLDRYLHRMQ